MRYAHIACLTAGLLSQVAECHCEASPNGKGDSSRLPVRDRPLVDPVFELAHCFGRREVVELLLIR